MANKKPTPKTQKEISVSQHTPYVNPETKETGGNPNDVTSGVDNRGNQLSFRGDTVKPFSIGIQDIDEAIFYYMRNIIKPTTIQNGVPQPVPVIYGSSEKWNQFQKRGYLRDVNGETMLPIIVVKRTNLTKDRTITNKLDANNPHNIQVFTKTYNKKNAYSGFNILNVIFPQKQYYAI